MIKTYIKLVLILLIISISKNVLSQNIPNNDLLERLNDKYKKIKDYSVDAIIKVDLPFIKMFPSNAKLYFKSKDKFKVVSKAISIVPKSGFSQITTILENYKSYACLNQGNEMISGIETTVLNLISPSDTSDLILCKLWIDPKLLLVYKSQLTTKSNGTILIEYKYGTVKEFSLPDFITFSIDVKKFKLPKVLGADINKSTIENPKDTKKTKKGTIYISLKNYKINKGVSDLIFK
jgi:hypothetical protein